MHSVVSLSRDSAGQEGLRPRMWHVVCGMHLRGDDTQISTLSGGLRGGPVVSDIQVIAMHLLCVIVCLEVFTCRLILQGDGHPQRGHLARCDPPARLERRLPRLARDGLTPLGAFIVWGGSGPFDGEFVLFRLVHYYGSLVNSAVVFLLCAWVAHLCSTSAPASLFQHWWRNDGTHRREQWVLLEIMIRGCVLVASVNKWKAIFVMFSEWHFERLKEWSWLRWVAENHFVVKLSNNWWSSWVIF